MNWRKGVEVAVMTAAGLLLMGCLAALLGLLIQRFGVAAYIIGAVVVISLGAGYAAARNGE